MRNIYFIALVAILISSCTRSCTHVGGKRVNGNGKTASEERSLSGFTKINVSGPYDVLLQQGTNFSVRIEGDENLLKYIDTHISGNALNISTGDGYNLKPKGAIKVFVTAPAIQELEVAGSGSIKSESKIISPSKIGMHISGSGTIILEIDAPEVRAEIGGSGSVTVKGATRNFKSEVAGSGEVHAFDLLSENSKIDIAGSGDAEVFASKTLDIAIAGSGDVRYKGTPVIKQSIAGSGNIRQIQ